MNSFFRSANLFRSRFQNLNSKYLHGFLPAKASHINQIHSLLNPCRKPKHESKTPNKGKKKT